MRVRIEVGHEGLGDSPVVVGFDASEGLSQPFDLEVQVAVEDPDLSFDDFLFTTAVLNVLDIDAPDDPPLRVFHGVIEAMTYLYPRGDQFVYALRLRPQVHALAYRVRSRIFQDLSVPDVVRAVLKDAGIPSEEVVWQIRDLPPREYCTQWKESELAFISRLLEEVGLYYWFEHDEDGHTMYIGDGSVEADAIDGPEVLVVDERGDGGLLGDRAYDLTLSSEFTYDKFSTRDWDWLSPRGPSDAAAGDDDGLFECYEYPGGFTTAGAARRRADTRFCDLSSTDVVLRGASSWPALLPGRTFNLFGAQVDALDGPLLIVGARHRYQTVGSSQTGEDGYEVTFTAIPASAGYSPPLRTPRPRIVGKELAVVTGPPGEEIHVDRFGRVKVHFYWDREGPWTDQASCWMRVQQQNTAGAMILPRVGWEVDVGFVNGNPDRPLVMEKLYNAETMPPYELPGNLMQSALQSSSSPGGGGTNEVRLNDSNGAMEFFMHAQKDFVLQIGNDFTETITVDALTEVKGSSRHGVTGDEQAKVGINQSVNITGRCTLDVASTKEVQVGASDELGVTAMLGVTVGGARSDTIGGLVNVLAKQMTETFNANETRTVGGVQSLNSGGPIVEAVAGNKVESVGGAKVELINKSKVENVGVGKLLNAGSVTLKTGGPLGFSADGAYGLKVGGPIVIKCDKDFNVSGSKVTITVGEALFKAGAKVSLTGGGATIQGDKIASSGSAILIKGNVDYVAGK
jgi:type VI secretion system secreted protein VgrG